MIDYKFSTHLQLSNGKRFTLQEETRPYDSGFPWLLCVTVITAVLCCDQSSEQLDGKRPLLDCWYQASTQGSFESWTVSRNILITGTWESRALRLGSVAENTVYTSTKVPMISAASPVPRLYPG